MVLKVMVMDKLDTGNKEETMEEVTMEEVTMEEICMDKETTPQTHTTVGQPTDKVKLIVVATTVDQTTDKVNTMVVAVTSKEVIHQTNTVDQPTEVTKDTIKGMEEDTVGWKRKPRR